MIQPRRRFRRSTRIVGAVAVFAVLAAACSSAGSPPPTSVAVSTPGASASISPRPAATPSSPVPASAGATTGPCDSLQLKARITLWDGAAGSRIADVELKNTGSVACFLRPLARPQLVDGKGSVLIDAAPAGSSSPPTAASPAPDITLAAGGTLRTQVRVGNYCGPAVTPPISVAFVLQLDSRVVATPLSPTDSGVPPCLGLPGSAGTVEMRPWAP